MAVFVEVKTLLTFLGFNRSKNNRIKITNLIRRVFCIIILLNVNSSLLWYVAFEAETFTEYADPMFILFSGTTCISLCLVLSCQIDRFEELFDRFDAKIEEREFSKNLH